MRRRTANHFNPPLVTFVTGTLAGALFGAGILLTDLGHFAALVLTDRESLVVATIVLPLLALFGISSLATLADHGEARSGRFARSRVRVRPGARALQRRTASPLRR